MTNKLSQLESILFVASKPLQTKKIAKILEIEVSEIKQLIEQLIVKFNHGSSGISIIVNNDEIQMATNPVNAEMADKFIKAEVSGDLTRPQLETLTVISYCGPITKPELEQIRGVNCSLILRNLLLRGLIQQSEQKGILPFYEVTIQYLRSVGISSVAELPNYEELHKHPFVEQAKGEE